MSSGFNPILRLKGTDIDGSLKALYGLTKIKGINVRFSNGILQKAGIDPNTRAGYLKESEIGKIEEIITNPAKFGLPHWLLNKRKNFETGKDLHLISANLLLSNKIDVDRMKKLKSWRGYRHSYGLKVRGQRTKTTGRRGKSLGVKKRVVMRRAG